MPTLKELREQHFLTQEELAKKSGIAAVTINRLENDRQKPSFKTIRKLATALGVEPGRIEFKQPAIPLSEAAKLKMAEVAKQPPVESKTATPPEKKLPASAWRVPGAEPKPEQKD